MNLGSENSGSTGKLYYYDSSGKLIYMDAGEVGADGNISLSFSHASEYVVIFERAPVEDEGVLYFRHESRSIKLPRQKQG